tara:strand:+ start:3689 stop:4279 length:591 start_codon:yes stop_codon:yes gene_type:complete
MNLIWKPFFLINFLLLLTICFAFSSPNNWINNNKEILSSDLKSASINLEINSLSFQQIDNSSRSVKFFLAADKKFRIDFDNRIIVSNGKNWKIYDKTSNQLFIQNPDKKLEKLLFSWSKIKKIKTFVFKKINKNEYGFILFDKENSAKLIFNKNELVEILIANDDLEVKISDIVLSKEKSIDLTVGNIDSEIFDLR